MPAILLSLVAVAIVLTVLFWLGSQALQNFLYTNANENLNWLAPLAALIIILYLLLWWLLNLAFTEPGTQRIPFGVPWEFTPTVHIIDQPVPEFESKRYASEPAIFKVDKTKPYEIRYRKKDSEEFWTADGVEYVKFKHDDMEYHFVLDKQRSREQGHIVFVDKKSGREMSEYEIGRLRTTSWTRAIVYLLLNIAHLAVWIVCFWLVLRFQLRHAVWLGIAMWLLFTMVIAPTLFAGAMME